MGDGKNQNSLIIGVAVIMVIVALVGGIFIGQGMGTNTINTGGLSEADKNYISMIEFFSGFCERQGYISIAVPQQLTDGTTIYVPACRER